MDEDTVNILKSVSREITNIPFDMVGTFYLKGNEIKVERLADGLNSVGGWVGKTRVDNSIEMVDGIHKYKITFYTKDNLSEVQNVLFVLNDRDVFEYITKIYNQVE